MEGKFFLIVDGLECYLVYGRYENSVNFFSTYVPEELRGRGFARHLISHGLAWARENNLRVIPSCSAVHRYILRHPDSVGNG